MVIGVEFGPIKRDERLAPRTQDKGCPRRGQRLDIDSLVAQIPIDLFHTVPRLDLGHLGIRGPYRVNRRPGG